MVGNSVAALCIVRETLVSSHLGSGVVSNNSHAPPHNTHHNQPFRPVGPSSLLGACWIMKAPPIITKAFWICGRHCCIHPSLTKAAYEILKLIKPLLKCFAFHKSPGPLLVY